MTIDKPKQSNKKAKPKHCDGTKVIICSRCNRQIVGYYETVVSPYGEQIHLHVRMNGRGACHD